MQRIRMAALFLLAGTGAYAQGLTYQTIELTSPPGVTVDFAAPDPAYEPTLVLVKKEHPQPRGEYQLNKARLDAERRARIANAGASMQRGKKANTAPPQLGKNFFGNVSQGTPNDNDIAVSNSGKFIMSATNTNYNMYNDTGKFLNGKTLSGIAVQLGALNRTFDPRVIYDPVRDRFIAVFLQGSTHADTRAIVGFSQTEDPTKTWKFYALPGNVWGDSSWSDYPIISITNDELFLTLNRVKDNTPWQTGFIESLIWQMELSDGYAGDSLTQKLYTDIRYNGKPIWSICPARGGSQLYGPNMYFISMRPSDLTNDTVFLHEVTNTIASGKAQLKLTVLRSDVAYGLQPNAIQPSGELLQTNDARALSAMYEDEKIQFTGNCMYQANFSPGFYHGVIDHVFTTPELKGKIIGSDTMDIGYPSIAYAGSKGDNNSAMITCSYVSKRSYPGTLAYFVDRNREYSAPTIVKTGNSSVNMLQDTLERWGDYTGIQRKYNELGVFWLNGSYGNSGNNNTWIARITSTDPRLGIQAADQAAASAVLFPNPVKEYAAVEFEVKEAIWVTFELYDNSGKLVAQLLKDKAKAGLNRFSINTNNLKDGVYYVRILHENEQLANKIMVVAHQ